MENSGEDESKTFNIESVLTNLKIVSNLKPNDKLTSANGILVIDTPYYTQGVYRWWNQDSRTNTMTDLEDLVNKAFEIIDHIYSSEIKNATGNDIENNYYYKHSQPDTYFKNENSQQLQNFSSELQNTIKGLQNLKITYKEDISICSKIDVMIEKIGIRIKKINQLLTIKPNINKLN